jgi:hypothetical protein
MTSELGKILEVLVLVLDDLIFETPDEARLIKKVVMFV